MVSIALSQSIDQPPAPEDRAEPFDYTAHFRSAELGKEALKLKRTSIRFLKRNFDFILKFGESADGFRASCCSFSGDEQGTIDFNSWLAKEGEPGHVTKAALKIYEWYISLTPKWQRVIRATVANWSFSALTVLDELNTEILHLFFWGAELLQEQRKHKKKKETKDELKVLVKASKGIRKVCSSQPLEIADWIYIYSLTGVERAHFDLIHSFALEIAPTSNREVYLDSAIAALNEFGYNTSAIDTVKEKAPTTEKKVYTESDLEKEREKARCEAIASYEEKLELAKEKARLEAIAAYEEKLAQKEAELAAANARLEQVTQQLQTATTDAASSLNNSIDELMAQIAQKDKEIEGLKKRLDCALQDTDAPQNSPTSKLKIDDLAVVPQTDPIATIFRDSTPPPIEIASYQKSAVYSSDWDSKKYQLSLVTALNEQTTKTSRQNNARPSTFVKKGFARG